MTLSVATACTVWVKPTALLSVRYSLCHAVKQPSAANRVVTVSELAPFHMSNESNRGFKGLLEGSGVVPGPENFTGVKLTFSLSFPPVLAL